MSGLGEMVRYYNQWYEETSLAQMRRFTGIFSALTMGSLPGRVNYEVLLVGEVSTREMVRDGYIIKDGKGKPKMIYECELVFSQHTQNGYDSDDMLADQVLQELGNSLDPKGSSRVMTTFQSGMFTRSPHIIPNGNRSFDEVTPLSIVVRAIDGHHLELGHKNIGAIVIHPEDPESEEMYLLGHLRGTVQRYCEGRETRRTRY